MCTGPILSEEVLRDGFDVILVSELSGPVSLSIAFSAFVERLFRDGILRSLRPHMRIVYLLKSSLGHALLPDMAAYIVVGISVCHVGTNAVERRVKVTLEDP